MAERQSGQREESIISNLTIESAEDVDEAAWCQLGRELEGVGVTSTMMQDNRAFIVDWMKSALNSGQLEDRECQPERVLCPLPGVIAYLCSKLYRTPRFGMAVYVWKAPRLSFHQS